MRTNIFDDFPRMSGTDGGRNWDCRTNAVGGWCSRHPCDYALKPISEKPIPTTYPQCADVNISFGQPGTMYPHILRLADGRLLVTYTQRCNGMSPYHGGSPPSSYNAPACGVVHDGYGTGLRAILASEEPQTSLSFDLERDVIVLKAQDDWFNVFSAKGCGCGCETQFNPFLCLLHGFLQEAPYAVRLRYANRRQHHTA